MSDLHPDLTPEQRRRLLHEGVCLFNGGRFFDAHEAFEEVWRSTSPEPKELLQGLIQVAVGMFHYHERDRADVARRVLAKGRRRLESYSDEVLGMEISEVVRDVRCWEKWLGESLGDPPARVRVRLVDEGALR